MLFPLVILVRNGCPPDFVCETSLVETEILANAPQDTVFVGAELLIGQLEQLAPPREPELHATDQCRKRRGQLRRALPLQNQTTYYCGVIAVDDAENSSVLSDIVIGTTLDEVAPGILGNLEVSFEVSSFPLTVDSASSELDSRFLKENAADGDPSSDWMSQALTAVQPEWIVFDLGSVQTLGEVRLLSDDGNAKRFPKGFEIQVSTDKLSWASVRNESNFVAVPSTWYPFPFVDTPGRYVRIWVNDMNLYGGSWYLARFAEVEVYTSGGPQIQATLTWLGTGDDGNAGVANAYEVRFDTDVIDDEASFNGATLASGIPPVPLAPGTPQIFAIPDGLTSETIYYFAIKTLDESGNFSLTFTSGTTPTVTGSPVDLVAPGEVGALDVTFAPSSLPLTVDSASSERPAVGFFKENIVDGDLSTVWMSEAIQTPSIQWIIVDLGSAITIDEVQLRSDDNNAKRFPRDFEVQVSTDKVFWNMVDSRANFSATPSTWYSFPFAARSARYVRIWVTDMNPYGAGYLMASIAEIQVNATTSTFEATLSWNATGDDGDDGTAFSYDIRFDTSVINDETSFDNATEVDGEPFPAPSGNAQMFTLPAPLIGGTFYSFAIKTSDAVGNFSLTVVSRSTP